MKDNKTIREEEMKGLLTEEVKTIYKMIQLMQPKSEAEFIATIATVLPNLHIGVFHFVDSLLQETKKAEQSRLRQRIIDYANKKFLKGEIVDPLELYEALTKDINN